MAKVVRAAGFVLKDFPLCGRHLIEASAGTGKTYVLTRLYTRAILGHGVDRPLGVDEILAVTFTDLATAELKDKIGSLMRGVLAFLQGDEHALQADDPLRTLLHELPDRGAALLRLDLALQRLDEACVYTIHGFCWRVLNDHALESQIGFDHEFLRDDADYLRGALTDQWRALVYRGDLLGKIAWRRWDTPGSLYEKVRALAARQQAHWLNLPAQSSAELLKLALTQLTNVQRSIVEENICARLPESRFRKAADTPAHPSSITKLTALANADVEDALPELDVKWLAIYGTENLRAADPLKARASLVWKEGEFSHCVDTFLATFKQLGIRMLADLVLAARREASLRRRREGLLSSDDVLLITDTALQSANGPTLARELREQFKLALIDEFQDTDPAQWRIFDAIYSAKAIQNQGCVLIGDPKQAIYGFRGADVYSYLQAKSALADEAAQLNDSFRATPKLLAALNHLYDRAAAPQGSFGLPDIQYRPLVSRVNADLLWPDGRAPLHFSVLSPEVSKANIGQLRTALSQWAARDIENLLAASETIQPADVVVLVRSSVEGRRVRADLAKLGIGAAFLDRANVFGSEAAQLLALLLRAWAAPTDERLRRALLLSRLGGFSSADLLTLEADATTWQRISNQVMEASMLLRSHGLLAAVLRHISDFSVAARWLEEGLPGARRLTDLRHLASVAQSRGVRSGLGPQWLQWLKAQRSDNETSDEVHQLRLESDDTLVRILTIHAAKGLEFPIVYLPFVSLPPQNLGKFDAIYQQPQGICIDLEEQSEAAQQVMQMGEELRLLYVAVTRAKRGCVIGVADTGAKVRNSALKELLVGKGGRSLPEAVVDLANGSQKLISVAPMPDAQSRGPHVIPAAEEVPNQRARKFNGFIDRRWQLHSYSAWVRGEYVQELAAGHHDELTSIDESPAAPTDIRFAFPAGARAGVCLHRVLERWPEHQGRVEEVDAILHSHGFFDVNAAAVSQWLSEVRRQPLSPLRTCLADVVLYPEIEFNLPIASLNLPEFNAVLIKHNYSGLANDRTQLHGLLRGFIDAVFVHEGCYYLVDYKSNKLGLRLGDYGLPQLNVAMREHRYDVQGLLYAVALRRWLRLRGVDNSPQWLYLFVRGMSGGGGIHHHAPSTAVLDELDVLL